MPYLKPSYKPCPYGDFGTKGLSMDPTARQAGGHSMPQLADRNTPPTIHANESFQQNPLHWPIFDLMAPRYTRHDPLSSAVIRSDGEHTVTGLENELNAQLESMTLRPTHQHFQTRAAGLPQRSNALSNSGDSGKTPMERFVAEGYGQGKAPSSTKPCKLQDLTLATM